ncbi:MAG TPA: hypothetical protein DCY88_19230 [Cyanobacteria bacterium UBA11372]|nr:hypothetical protein [Cyanobacteria bacterium UBA11372]
MNIEDALAFLETVLKPESLNHVQELVFRGAWEERVYEEIAALAGYDADYLRDVGSTLWRSLSKSLGEKVTKNNFRSVLRRRFSATANNSLSSQDTQTFLASNGNNNQHQDWGEAIDVSFFLGRTEELATLKQWILQDKCRLVAILGMGGMGKTALAIKLAEQIQTQFEYLIWRSLRNAPPVETILAEIVQFLSKQQETDLPTTLDSRICQLMYYLRSAPCLLILDNFESVLQSGNCGGRYREGYEGYGQFLTIVGEASHPSCLVLTSREKPRGLACQEGKTLPVRSKYLGGLQKLEMIEILIKKGLFGREEEWKKLSYFYAGNPLLLKIVATAIQDLLDGDIAHFLAQGTLVFGEIRDILDQQFNRLSDLEKQVMSSLAINSEAMKLEKLRQDIPSVSQQELLEVLQSLQARSLIEKTDAGFTQQPVVREYVTAIRSLVVSN